MDPNSSLGKICLGDDVVIISSDKVEGLGDWNSPEYQDTTVSKRKKVVNTLSFYMIEIDEISERYIAPCFVNGLEAYDGEVNLEFDDNLISNEFAINLCLDYEVKKEKNGRSFLRLAHEVIDFDNGVFTIYPEPDPFEDDYEKTGKSSDDWDQLLDFNFDNVPKFAGSHLTQEEAEKKALTVRISQKFALLEEERPAEAMGKLSNVLCQVEVTTIIVKFPILDIPVDCDAPIVVGRGFLHTIAKSNSDDEEECVIKRNRTPGTHNGEAGSSRSKCPRQHETVEEVLLPQVHHEFLLWEGCSRDAKSRHQNGYANVAWVIAKWMKRKGAGTQKESQIYYGQCISKLVSKCRVLTEDVVRSLSAPIYCRDLDTTTLRDLIESDGKLISEDPQPGVPRVGIPRPPRASMQDLYDRMEIHQEAIEHMDYRQSYHWDRYHGVFKHMAGVYSVPLQGAYNPPGYAQPWYDQYYQQYQPPPPQYQQQQDDDE
uniref:Uncharacterized protein n=1 Tax=Tanacetum cinerariifolium TaxID=118510 RepID=A0A6L2M5T6_TANCI|nr:hypothetical protein [Tanacetum cinerariifolium]